ncbi:hypothetical protein [Rhodospira trueperi]|jgi:hypothetical protein|uniref:Uncharacterized protein n=1 Tax=Rhodospira trueperi TaxID=69960 RepID=A0A1G6YS25_9PROT|nr:hypothetical protein [Rhodospira trueperi]SDD93082.1 hypothetical protein SAMN05421720_102107 [Rhodospira trueperi]
MLKKTYLATAAVCVAFAMSFSAPVAAEDVTAAGQQIADAGEWVPVSVRGQGMNARFSCNAVTERADRACVFGPPRSVSECVCEDKELGRTICYVIAECHGGAQ